MVDIVQDIPNAIKYFKGYGGADLAELTRNIAQYRAILVDPDGDVGSLDTEFNGSTFGELLAITHRCHVFL